MKRIFFIALFMASFMGIAQQVSAQNAQYDGSRMKERLKSELNLTDAQADSVMAINKDYMMQLRSLKADSTLSTTEKQTKMSEYNQQKTTRLQAVLSKEQMKQLEELQEKNKERMQKLRDRRNG